MSREYNVKQVRSGQVAANGAAAVGSQIAHPQNCKTECPYGYGRAFCFPCYAKGNTILINLEVFDEYMEQFREPPTKMKHPLPNMKGDD